MAVQTPEQQSPPLPYIMASPSIAAVLTVHAPAALERLQQTGLVPHWYGRAVWSLPYRSLPAVVVDTVTGQTWQRPTDGWWVPGGTRPAHAWLRLAELLAGPDDRVADVVAVLGQEPEDAGALLVCAQRAAAKRPGGADPARLRVTQARVSRAARLLARSDTAPHRVVETVESLDVLVASCWCDARSVAEPGWSQKFQDRARTYARRGAGRFAVERVHQGRAAAVAELELHRRWCRPGQSFRVEPADGAR